MMPKSRIVESSRQDQIELISGFIDLMLPLSPEEEQVFEEGLENLPPERREAVMKIITSWMEKGIRQGKQDLLVRQLRKLCGTLDAACEDRIGQLSVEQLDELGEALLEFSRVEELTHWLNERVSS